MTIHDIMETVSISKFKATCLARLKVKRTQPLRWSPASEPIAEVHTAPAEGVRLVGSDPASTGRIVGTLATAVEDWERCS